ncbi:MAG: Ku protein [Chloroflexi bacterium]|nr:Ku protein [Chloroflexota bacterium]
MARAMWKGAIQFGLVTIPVKLYLATESKAGVSFNMLHAPDLSRIQMKVWCPADEQVISRGDTVKGYEYAPDQYVVITDEDLEKVPLKTVRSIEIEQFAPRDEATAEHAKFTRQAYYIEPDAIGRKAFYLLRQVLAERGLTAICKVVIRDREALAALDPFENTMLLTTLHWPDEIRSTKELNLADEEFEFKPAELRMAEQLIEAMTEPFDPAKYRDEYREALLKVIEAKIEGVEMTQPEPVAESANIVDLMKLLEASVKAATDARTAGTEAPVSVTQAKEARASKAARAKAKAAADAAADAAAEATTADAPAVEARPARRRKSA